MARRTLYFGRSANVEPIIAPDCFPAASFRTSLTKRGREQAEARRASLGFVDFDAVFTSTFHRTIETAEIIAGISRDHEEIFFRMKELDVPPIWFIMPWEWRGMESGFAPLEKYLATPQQTEFFVNYGKVAVDALLALFLIKDDIEQEETLGIFGHQAYIQAIMLAMLDSTQSEFADTVLRMNLDEAGLVRMVIEGTAIIELEVL